MSFAIIGNGAMSRYLQQALANRGQAPSALILRPARLSEAAAGVPRAAAIADLPAEVTLVIDCGGHQALIQHGPEALRAGLDVITVSIGALADPACEDALRSAAQAGGGRLQLASGAIGALDALRAARAGQLDSVRYIGRKPPAGWVGSPAEQRVDLGAPMAGPVTHFTGSAREAALGYPKNANVAAAVALAGLGFDATQAELIADPTIAENIHEVHASGDFGSFSFTIAGRGLPDNPRTSALAAMSVLAALDARAAPIVF